MYCTVFDVSYHPSRLAEESWSRVSTSPFTLRQTQLKREGGREGDYNFMSSHLVIKTYIVSSTEPGEETPEGDLPANEKEC